jgi:hypothetical protein
MDGISRGAVAWRMSAPADGRTVAWPIAWPIA